MGCKIEFSILDFLFAVGDVEKGRTEIELNKLDFYAYNPSLIHSVFTHRNRVRWTRFLCRKTESIRLGFCTYKPSLIDSFFIHRNQVQWTRFLCVKTECIGLGLYAWKSSLFNSISVRPFPTSFTAKRKIKYPKLDFTTHKSTPINSNC